jgi:hypothetical protein
MFDSPLTIRELPRYRFGSEHDVVDYFHLPERIRDGSITEPTIFDGKRAWTGRMGTILLRSGSGEFSFLDAYLIYLVS